MACARVENLCVDRVRHQDVFAGLTLKKGFSAILSLKKSLTKGSPMAVKATRLGEHVVITTARGKGQDVCLAASAAGTADPDG
jgi:hypothetical protein